MTLGRLLGRRGLDRLHLLFRRRLAMGQIIPLRLFLALRLIGRQRRPHGGGLVHGLRLAHVVQHQHTGHKGPQVVSLGGSVDPVYLFHLIHHSPAVGGNTVRTDVASPQSVLQPEKAALHVRCQVDDPLQIAGPVLQGPQGLLQLRQLTLKNHGPVGQIVQDGIGLRHSLAEKPDSLFHRVQQVRHAAQVSPEAVRPVVQRALAAGEGTPGQLQLVQPLGGGVQAVLDIAECVQQTVDAAGEGPVVLLQVLFPLAELGNLLQLGQGGGHHQHRQAAEGEILAAHPDGKVPLLPRQSQE